MKKGQDGKISRNAYTDELRRLVNNDIGGLVDTDFTKDNIFRREILPARVDQQYLKLHGIIL